MSEKVKEMKGPTAAIIVIGDEILKGQIQDANTFFLTKELKECGIKVTRGVIIPDNIDVIAHEVQDLCDRFTYVFTCGGVGPTHDDVTFEGIAKGFNEDLVTSPEIVEVLQMHFKDNINDSILKMAKVPKSCNVSYSVTGKNSFPVITIKNCFILPGIPKLLCQTFEALKKSHLATNYAQHKTVVHECFIASDEFEITDQLNALVSKYEDSVTFGSYPQWTHNYYKTKLTIESPQKSIVDQVVKEIQETMETMDYDTQPTIHAMQKISKLLELSQDSGFIDQVKTANNVIQECFEKYKENQVAIAFNGGKDCMVLLHLVHAYVQKHHRQDGSDHHPRLQAVYISDQEPFPSVEEFIEESRQLYNLDLITIPGPMKEALTKLLIGRPHIKATLMGTRFGDPGSKSLEHFSPTDGDWPKLMRVNPILEWEYSYVWKFLRGLTLPYPDLYDKGYTSLGSQSNTLPNPNLAKKNGTFEPAFKLQDGALERAGRGKKAS